jgi:hypothetical protein
MPPFTNNSRCWEILKTLCLQMALHFAATLMLSATQAP